MEEEEDYVGSLQCVCGSERVTVPLFGTAAVGKGDGGGGGGEQRRRPPPSSVPPPSSIRDLISPNAPSHRHTYHILHFEQRKQGTRATH